jgi:hypothetical protein
VGGVGGTRKTCVTQDAQIPIIEPVVLEPDDDVAVVDELGRQLVSLFVSNVKKICTLTPVVRVPEEEMPDDELKVVPPPKPDEEELDDELVVPLVEFPSQSVNMTP